MQKGISTLVVILIIIAVAVVSAGGVLLYQYLTTQPEEPAQPSITVTSPNGGEQWQIGTTHDITWNAPPGFIIEIYLEENGSASCIAEVGQEPGTSIPCGYGISYAQDINSEIGKYSWLISNGRMQGGSAPIPPGNYTIKICQQGTAGTNCDESNAPFSISSADPTANWKTYTNTQYGFEFKYSSEYAFYDSGLGNAIFAVGLRKQNQFSFSTRIYPRNGETINQWISQDVGSDGVSHYSTFVKNINVDGINGVIAIPVIVMGGENYYTAIFPKDNYMYETLITSEFSKTPQETVSLLEQIISTFKFTK